MTSEDRAAPRTEAAEQAWSGWMLAHGASPRAHVLPQVRAAFMDGWEAAAPGAALDVDRLARQVRQLPTWSPHPDIRDRITGNLVKEDDVVALLRAEYQRLGATPDPLAEPPR